MSKTIHKLEIPLYSVAFLGVACAEPIHRLSWLINKQLGVYFTAKQQTTELIAPFATFQYFNEELSLHFMLIANKAQEKTLAPELRNIDYILACIGHDPAKPISQWNTNIKKVEGVVGCYLLPSDKGTPKKLAATLLK